MLNRMIALVALGVRMPTPFAPDAGWKVSADGKSIEMKDGNPIWVDANGGEQVMQGDTISRLNTEAATLRKRAETAEGGLKAFDGLDAETAKKAIETVGKIDAKKLIDAGEVDKVRDSMKSEFTGQITELANKNKTLQDRIDGMSIDAIFAGSEFIRERVAIPRDMFEASVRKHVVLDKDGKIVFNDKAGNRIMSKKNIGEHADAEEALALIVDAHPQRDTILRAENHGGSGNNGAGGGDGRGRKMSRSEFEKLPPMEQAEMAKQMGEGKVTITE